MDERERRGRDELVAIYRDHVWDVYDFFAYRLGNPPKSRISPRQPSSGP